MKLLLDTHTLLWFIGGSKDLSAQARAFIEDNSNSKFVSIVSIWETAIKVSIGKMTLMTAFDELFPEQLNVNGFELLPVRIDHTSMVSTLPFHHRDPFDRLLVAQALSESMSILSVDDVFDSYGVNRLW